MPRPLGPPLQKLAPPALVMQIWDVTTSDQLFLSTLPMYDRNWRSHEEKKKLKKSCWKRNTTNCFVRVNILYILINILWPNGKSNIEFIRWFHECSVIMNLRIFEGTEFVWLFLCNVDVNNNIHFRSKKIVDSWLQNSWNYRMNSIQVCVDRFVNMFLTIRFGKHILVKDPSELKFYFVH